MTDLEDVLNRVQRFIDIWDQIEDRVGHICLGTDSECDKLHENISALRDTVTEEW